MTVYVDALFRFVSKKPRARFVGGRTGHKWCHMFADTLEELHKMADAIGLEREWFQGDHRFPHYDLTPNKRAKAVDLGARQKATKDILLQIELKRRAERQAEAQKIETKAESPTGRILTWGPNGEHPGCNYLARIVCEKCGAVEPKQAQSATTGVPSGGSSVTR